MIFLLQLRIPVNEVEQREQEDPYNIDEVPVQPEVFYRSHVPGTEVSSHRTRNQPDQQPNADDHVQRVHTRHRKVQREEDLRLLRHVWRQWLLLVKAIRL